jgi:predicted dithiol-disulfide oxidoreductase (DUF899 family)
MPNVVSAEEWERAHAALLAKEKEATRAGDALAAERRRLPMVRIDGVESLGSVWTFLDLTPMGRQEEWEDSPEGTPQTPPYEWWRRHDEYE